MNDRDKMVKWLSTTIHKDYMYFDMLNKHCDYLLNYLHSKNIKLHENVNYDIFFIRFIAFIYQNSNI